MEIGRDWDPVWKNKWPREGDVPGFKSTMLQFFLVSGCVASCRHIPLIILLEACHDLHMIVMRSIALGLDLPEDFFDDKIDQQYHNLRLLSYPPIRTKLLSEEGKARAGAHSGVSCFIMFTSYLIRVYRLWDPDFTFPGCGMLPHLAEVYLRFSP